MVTISIEVSDDLVKAYGVQALQERMKRLIHLEKLTLLVQDIQDAVSDAELVNEELLEQARENAWNEFKANKLKDIME